MRFLRDALLTIALLAVVVLVVGALSIRNRFSAVPDPGRVESALALRVRNLSVPAEAREARNPLAADPAARRQGEETFGEYCAVCHNTDGRGGGAIGPHLNPRVPDLTSARTRSLTDGELFYFIEQGVRWTGMPAWKNELSPEETWQLVAFIRRLPSGKGEKGSGRR